MQQQLSLFDTLSLVDDMDKAVKSAMNRALRESKRSRDEVLDRMNEIAASSGVRLNRNARTLSMEVLEKWLNPGDVEHKPGIQALHIFMAATGSLLPLQTMAMAHGGRVIDRREARLLERAELEEKIKKLQAQKKKIDAELS